ASFSSIVRDPGSARFSGTGNSAQNAASVAAECGRFNSQPVSVSLPIFSVLGGAGFTGLVGDDDAEAGSLVISLPASARSARCCLPHHCQPSAAARITTAT